MSQESPVNTKKMNFKRRLKKNIEESDEEQIKPIMLSKILNEKANVDIVDTATSTKKHVEEEMATIGRIKRKIKRNLADLENEYNQSNNDESQSDHEPAIQLSDGSDADFIIEQKPKKGRKKK